MNETILYITLFALAGIFFYMLIATIKNEKRGVWSYLRDWKINLVLIAVSYFLFFIYTSTTISLVQLSEQVINGSDVYSITNNGFIIFVNLMIFVNAFMTMIFGFGIINTLRNMRIFGRQRTKTIN